MKLATFSSTSLYSFTIACGDLLSVYQVFSRFKVSRIEQIHQCFGEQFADDPMKKPKRIVDVGCGIGGSSRYFARKYDAECKGITLSPVQAKRAQALAVAEGLQGTV